ncbi:helix-turn-helix domain-containing protein [Paenibacillus sp. FSL R10-2736]|uniref:helix-turn-helix domain-containing protein n=1 Tax=Paenibacillus sp. FSL R10-2736 TaxID=2954692 RepID=UPI0030FD16D6
MSIKRDEAKSFVNRELMVESTTGVQNDRIFCTVAELAEFLPLGMNSLYKLVAREDFPKVKIGRKILIPIAKIETYLVETKNL